MTDTQGTDAEVETTSDTATAETISTEPATSDETTATTEGTSTGEAQTDPVTQRPLVDITLAHQLNIVLAGVRFVGGKARTTLTPLQRRFLTNRGARFEDVTEATMDDTTTVETTTEVAADEGTTEEAAAAYPEGAPAESWTHKQIDAWAADQTPPIVFVGDATKTEKLAQIAA